ncbi:hypothetical protein J2Z69_003178 [Paenibacillus shirakamiensis]|uniref:YheC/YheD family protein n=1 Tax=Paenibacillus shirakamiensis TaxID=1265935 RepID=A0ABS4JMA7_9BACL|nr:YheC/YheD family protein [Paenibacillus shirakamiensis]MBP2002121.1 hypothetical protein [Paenibacillus shirakamiensis]
MGLKHVGILLNARMHRGIPRRKTGQESISNYEEAAAEFGLLPCYLRVNDIDLHSGTTAAYIYNKYEFKRVIVPIPEVIHNRAIYEDASAHRKIQALIQQGSSIFNVNNRYGKDEMHRYLRANPFISHYLPDTAIITPSTLRRFMENYDDLILKPCRGSVGRGVMRLQKSHAGWKITYVSSLKPGNWLTTRLRGEEFPPAVKHRLSLTPYLVQERIPLAEYDGRSFDLRVTVQRGIQAEWAVTGMFAKRSAAGIFISNLAGGGSASSAYSQLSEVMPSLQAMSVLAEVEHLSLAIASYLASHLPLLADLGLDIGVTAQGHIYFIECNGRDQRYGFNKAGMSGTWKATYRQPMAFARYLLNQ